MPRVAFTNENKVATVNYDYPKLSLKKDEKARILVGLEDPIYEYVHTLRKPLVVDGVPVMTTATRKDKSTYETNEMQFVGRPLCLGDATILSEKGSDPAHCPMCKLAKDYPDYAQPPQRRFAMHVIRYRTKASTFNVATPFSVELLVWAFGDRVFNQLVEAREEWKDLRKHDLQLTCKTEKFQQFEINVGASAEWLTDPERKALVAQTFRDNQIDLTIACGTSKKREWIEQDVAAVLEAWAEVKGAESSSGLDEGLDSLFSGAPAAPVQSASTGTGLDIFADLGSDLATRVITDDMVDENGVILGETVSQVAHGSSDDLLADLVSDSVVGLVDPPAAEQPAAPAAVDNFDDLLAGL